MTALASPPAMESALDINPSTVLIQVNWTAIGVLHCKCRAGGIFIVHAEKSSRCPSCNREYQLVALAADGVSKPPQLAFNIIRITETKVSES
jgi:hypothetical protein